MIVYVGGIPGVGKTKLVDQLHGATLPSGTSIESAKLKDVLCELAGVDTVTEFRLLSEEVRGSLHLEATRRIYELDSQNPRKIRLYDSHFCSMGPDGRVKHVRPIHPKDRGQLLAVVVLVTGACEILSRRIADTAFRTDRHITTETTVKREQALECREAKSQVLGIGVPIRFLLNNRNDAENVLRQTIDFLAEVTSQRGLG